MWQGVEQQQIEGVISGHFLETYSAVVPVSKMYKVSCSIFFSV